MGGDHATGYLDGLTPEQAAELAQVNGPGLTALRELGLDRWRTGDVFGETELPVLFAHGQHNRPDSVVLATTEYRLAAALSRSSGPTRPWSPAAWTFSPSSLPA